MADLDIARSPAAENMSADRLCSNVRAYARRTSSTLVVPDGGRIAANGNHGLDLVTPRDLYFFLGILGALKHLAPIFTIAFDKPLGGVFLYEAEGAVFCEYAFFAVWLTTGLLVLALFHNILMG